jgi:hypothetical protein
MKQINLILIALLFLMCNQNNLKEKEVKSVSLLEHYNDTSEVKKVKKKNFHPIFNGDWISRHHKVKYRERSDEPNSISFIIEGQYILSFDDETFLHDSFGKYEYEFEDNTLIKVKLPKEKKNLDKLNQLKKFQFKVKQTSDTTIFLIPLDSFTRNNVISDEKYKANIKIKNILFTKLSPKNTIKPKRIGFYSRAYAPCFYVEIDDNRNIFYYGIRDVKKIGGYVGKISLEDYNSILCKVQQIQLDDLKESYYNGISHSSEYGIYIEGQNKSYESRVHGTPLIELEILQTKLRKIKEEELIKSENVWDKFKCRNFMTENIHELRNSLSEKEFRQKSKNSGVNNK